jgi:predicted TPR repeat methyltransferase
MTRSAESENPQARQWFRQAVAHRENHQYGKAVALLRQVLAQQPGDPDALREMALAAYETGALDIAGELIGQSLQAAPLSPAGLTVLGRIRAAAGKPAEAVDAYRKAVSLAPRDAATFALLAESQLDLGDRELARKSLRKALKLNPRLKLAAHMLAALEDGAAAPRNAYTSALFDQYADTFEDHMSALGYAVPTALRQLVDSVAPDRRFAAAADLGCGTGLVAAAFADCVGAIDGIDVSTRMIEAAGRRGLYRDLEVADVATWLQRPASSTAYDLVLAADVFIYVGRLEAVFAGVAAALRPGGLFAFSVEHADSGEVEIRSSGRFAHAPDYIETLAAAHGMVRRAMETADIRSERGVPIPGRLLVLERP